MYESIIVILQRIYVFKMIKWSDRISTAIPTKWPGKWKKENVNFSQN